LNERILSLAATLVASTTFGCRQAASSSIYEFVVKFIRLGVSLLREAIERIVGILPRVDAITDHANVEAIRQNADAQFQTAMAHLVRLHFISLVVDAGTVH
jgi:hypothetical protein